MLCTGRNTLQLAKEAFRINPVFGAAQAKDPDRGAERGFFHILKAGAQNARIRAGCKAVFPRFTSSVLVTKLSFADIENGFGLMAAVKKMQDIVFQAIGRCPVLC